EIFDEETTRQIEEEHVQDMDDAVRAIGARRMGLITGDTDSPSSSGGSGGLMSKLSSVTSVFSRKKAKPKAKTSSAPHPPSPPPVAEKSKPQLPPSTSEETKEAPPQKTPPIPSTAIQGSPLREGEGNRVTEVSAPVTTAAAHQGPEAGEEGKVVPPTDATAAIATAEELEEQEESVNSQDYAVKPPTAPAGTAPPEGNEFPAAAATAADAAQGLTIEAEKEGTVAPLTDAPVVTATTEGD
ncbi:unnamed protein product, partial [Laminaria digitata]